MKIKHDNNLREWLPQYCTLGFKSNNITVSDLLKTENPQQWGPYSRLEDFMFNLL